MTDEVIAKLNAHLRQKIGVAEHNPRVKGLKTVTALIEEVRLADLNGWSHKKALTVEMAAFILDTIHKDPALREQVTTSVLRRLEAQPLKQVG